ncbi:MAG: cytochrome P450 [Vulcanimicrobiaceae bacterium]
MSTATAPGPRAPAAYEFFGGGRRTIEFLERTARRYGPVAGFRIGGRPIYLLDDAELIEEVLVTAQHRYVRDTGALLVRELVGEALVSSEEPAHVRRRRMMQPAFHRARVTTYASVMAGEAESLGDAWEERALIDVGADMTRLTLAVVGEALLGADVGDSARAVAGVVARVIRRGTVAGPAVALAAPLFASLRRRFPERASLLFPREREELDRIVRPLIEARRGDADQRGDLLSLLLQARDADGSALSDGDLRNELVTLILAGHETTASALTWTWYLLATHPVVEACMHAELDALLGERIPSIEDLPRLRYTSSVFDEALRLYPPAPAFGRRPLEDVELGGYRIERMASIFVSPYVTQRNPRYFDDPLAFRPERWEGPPPPKFAYFPFGAGSKMCIGEPFARLEGVLVLATLARRYRLRLLIDRPLPLSSQAMLRPGRPIVMRTEARRGAALHSFVHSA